MPGFTISSDTPVNHPGLRQLLQVAGRVADLSVRKAVLHHAHPRRFPIDHTAKSLESILTPVFRQLPAEQQERLKSTGTALAQGSSPQARTAAPLPGVDLASPRPVWEQAYGSEQARRALTAPVPAGARVRPGDDTDDDWPRVGPGGIDRWPPAGSGGGGGGGTGQRPAGKRIVLRLHQVKCVKETGDPGKDEIDLAVGAVHIVTLAGNPRVLRQHLVSPFRVGSFRQGRVVQLNARPLYRLEPPQVDQFPTAYMAVILLVERDSGRDTTILKNLGKIIDELVVELQKAAAALGFPDDEDGGDILKGILGFALLYTIAKVWDLVAGWFGDEAFDAGFVSLNLNTPDLSLPGGGSSTEPTVLTVVRDGGKKGRYEILYSWAVVEEPAAVVDEPGVPAPGTNPPRDPRVRPEVRIPR